MYINHSQFAGLAEAGMPHDDYAYSGDLLDPPPTTLPAPQINFSLPTSIAGIPLQKVVIYAGVALILYYLLNHRKGH